MYGIAPFDFDVHYTHPDFRGVALWAARHPVEHADSDDNWEPDPDYPDEMFWMGCEKFYGDVDCTCEPDVNQVVVYMVGDDRPFVVDCDDLVKIDRSDYCGECGQIGCTHDGYNREEF